MRYGTGTPLTNSAVPARINDIVRERRGITPDTALRLARYFGGDAETWLSVKQTQREATGNTIGATGS